MLNNHELFLYINLVLLLLSNFNNTDLQNETTKKMRLLFPLIFVLFISSCNNDNVDENDETPEYDPTIETPHVNVVEPKNITYQIINKFPHDTSAYTQGLEIHDGKLYESTGDYENSSIRITDSKTGKVEKKHMMGTTELFGEGITIFKNKIYQLTWENNIVFVYNVNQIEKPITTLKWPFEGWGITHDTAELIISDGTSNLYFVDPITLKVRNTMSVKDNHGPVEFLNELEYVNGYVYANVYQSNNIVKINPETGIVEGMLTFNGLMEQSDYIPFRTDVLNGIAYDSISKNFFITGKRWPKMFEIKFN